MVSKRPSQSPTKAAVTTMIGRTEIWNVVGG
jgi:hypothetical protein